jgi:hypothetical protein
VFDTAKEAAEEYDRAAIRSTVSLSWNCNDNADADWIPTDDEFPSGADLPPDPLKLPMCRDVRGKKTKNNQETKHEKVTANLSRRAPARKALPQLGAGPDARQPQSRDGTQTGAG